MMTAHETENYYRFELKLWGKTWTSRDGEITRFYLDHDAVCTLIGLDGENQTLDGEKVSYKVAGRLSMGSWWIENGVLHGDRDTDPEMVAKAAAKLTEMMTPAVEETEEDEVVEVVPGTEHATYNNVTGDVTVEATITAVLGADGKDLDVDTIATKYREAINAALPDGVTLNGDLFFGPADYAFDRSEIWEIIDNISISNIAASLTEIRWTSFEDAHQYVTEIIGDPADVVKENPTEPDFIYNTENITRKLIADLIYIDDADIFDGHDLSEILEDVTPFAYVEASRIYLAEGCTVRAASAPTEDCRTRYEATCKCGTVFGTWAPSLSKGLCASCDTHYPTTSTSLSDLMDSTRAGL